MASIEKHGDKYRVIWREGDVKQRRSFDTEEQAENFKNTVGDIRALKRDQDHFVKNLTAGSRTPRVVDYGREVFAARTLKRKSEEMYATALRRIEAEPLGKMEVGRVGAKDIRQFFTAVEKNRGNVKAVLAMIFVAAKREGLIRLSPMDAAQVKLPKRRQKNINTLTTPQIIEVAKHAHSEMAALGIRLGGLAGLRAGEVGGLKADDIDLERCRLTIRGNAQRVTKRDGETSSVVIGSPKSDAGERTITVDCVLVADLVAYMDEHPPLADGLVFRTTQGNPATDQVWTRHLIQAAKDAGFPRMTFHDLRHAYATNLARAKLPMPVLQYVMGWSSIAMTDTYAHVAGSDVDEAAAIMTAQQSG